MSQSRPPARATIADVAEYASVSTATVSRVINRTGPVAPETEEAVRDAIAALNYRPHTAAKILASNRTNTLGLIFPQISGYYFAPLLRGIAACAGEYGFDLLIYSVQEGSAPREPFTYPIGDQNTDGLVVFTDGLPEQELRRLCEIAFPVVLIHCTPPAGLRIPSVTIENKASARQLVDHLIEVHGRRRIGFLAGPKGHEDSYWREKGYRESLAAHNIPYNPALVSVGGFNESIARAAVEKWLQEGIEMDAIFTGDDDSATGALAALIQAGKRVPDDVALVGFDDIDLARYLNPPLTTVRAPVEQVGYEAVRQLVRLIRTGEVEPLILLPTQLVIRQSCGCT
ncbi:MAG TPA: LacI family DNA-binding transcriptional regulator [Anaerolineae bacterium]|nr:LacI family DNA-binding transcriptional regulator [Anaerolineae bacterium]HQI85067.1 LacI family DNA-binding transcriptional regulator [Anaerolineae bacterium]